MFNLYKLYTLPKVGICLFVLYVDLRKQKSVFFFLSSGFDNGDGVCLLRGTK